MRRSTEFIRALEHHRVHTMAHRQPTPERPSIPLLLSWIHHDNMLEGSRYKTAEISQALLGRDEDIDRYLHPLMANIRRYRDAICFVWNRAHEGSNQVNIDSLKRIHRMITPDPRDRGGQYRQTSPVHRDYFQAICAADRIPYQLRKIFEQIDEEFDCACDPVQFAAIIHHKLMYAYPFRRKPGSTARLFTNMLLLSRGYPPAIIPSHQRDAYYHALNHPEPERLVTVFANAVHLLMERLRTPLGLIEGHA